jgi:Protein of unknown function (DUF3352)
MQEPNSPIRKKRRRRPSPKRWRLIAGILATAATAMGIYLAFANRSTTSKLDIPAGANYLPANTLVAVTLATDRQRWQQLQQLGTPQSRAAISQELAKWQQEFLTNNGLDFERDIQPAIGSDIAVAYLAPPMVPTASSKDSAPVKNLPIILLPLNSDQAATQFFAKTKAAPGTPGKTVERTYQGVTLRESTHNNNILVTAIVDRVALISPSAPAIEQAINAFKSGKTLAKSPGYPQAWRAISMHQPLAQVYVNVPLAVANHTGILAPDKLAQLQQQQGLAANINLEGNLISSKGISWWQSSQSTKLVPNKNSPDFGQRLPANTLMMISGSSLTQLWNDYLPLANQNPVAPVPPTAIVNSLKSTTGLDLTTDILAWSQNEFLLALVPAQQTSSNSLGGSLLLMLKPSDRSAAAAMFQKLDQAMTSRYQFQVAPAKTKNTEVVNWSSPIGGVNATHGWLSDNLAFLALGTPVTDQFLPQPADTLANNKQFQQVMKSEIAPYNGQFFINLDKMQQSQRALLPQLTPTAQSILSGMNAIGLTSNASSSTTNRFDLSVSLKQVAAVTSLSPLSNRTSLVAPGSNINPR